MQNIAWLPLALGSALFASLVAIFGKIGVSSVDPTVATSVRAIIMAVFVFLIVLGTGKISSLSQITSKEFIWILASGIAGAISWIFYFWALKFGPAGKVATIDRLSLVFVVFLAAIFLAEKISWKTGLGVILVVIGAYLVASAK
jgi:transporter family protein